MGYRIDYQPVKKVRDAEKRRSGSLPLTALCFLLFCLLVNWLDPVGAEVMRELLIPGDAAVTAAALDGFAEELKAGEELEDALKYFCQKLQEGEAD